MYEQTKTRLMTQIQMSDAKRVMAINCLTQMVQLGITKVSRNELMMISENIDTWECLAVLEFIKLTYYGGHHEDAAIELEYLESLHPHLQPQVQEYRQLWTLPSLDRPVRPTQTWGQGLLQHLR